MSLSRNIFYNLTIQLAGILLMYKEIIGVRNRIGIGEIGGLQVSQGVVPNWLLIASVKADMPQVVTENSFLISLSWSTLEMLSVLPETRANVSRAVRGVAHVIEVLESRCAHVVGAFNKPSPLPLEIGVAFILENAGRAELPSELSKTHGTGDFTRVPTYRIRHL